MTSGGLFIICMIEEIVWTVSNCCWVSLPMTGIFLKPFHLINRSSNPMPLLRLGQYSLSYKHLLSPVNKHIRQSFLTSASSCFYQHISTFFVNTRIFHCIQSIHQQQRTPVSLLTSFLLPTRRPLPINSAHHCLSSLSSCRGKDGRYNIKNN